MVAPGSDVPTDQVATRAAARLERREVLTKERPAGLLALIGLSALSQGVGGRQVMIGQLNHLLEMAARPNIDLRIIPNNCGWHPGLEGGFTLIDSSRTPSMRNSSATLTSVVVVGTRRSALMLHANNDVNAYRRAIDHIMNVTLQPDVSARLIADIRNRMENHRDN